MVVGEDGLLSLPWLAAPLSSALSAQRGHALLVHGSEGVGALHFALSLAQAWLCEAPEDRRREGPCGRCGSCRLVQSHLHPDLFVLLPETLRRAHQWPLLEDKTESEDKRKPSRQIRITEVRTLIDWSHKTSARGRGKVGVLHPAEAMNATSASALLKTLEEAPVGTRLLLTCADPALLLPTVRSRCQHLRLGDPPDNVATDWLRAQGVQDPAVLLAACSARPLDALAMSQAGVDAERWSNLPLAVRRGDASALTGWGVPRALDALMKLCHDAMARTSGGAPRYFPADRLPAASDLQALGIWLHELQRVARHDEHPWHEGLLLDALVRGGASALAPRSPDGRRPNRVGLDTLGA